jgi:hypothetical protein
MKSLSTTYPDKACYVCGRSVADLCDVRRTLENLLENDTNEVVSPLEKAIEERKKEILKKYEKIGRMSDNPGLEFDVATVTRDLPKFRKLIPEIDDLLEFHKEYSNRARNYRSNPTLLEIRNRVRNASTPEIDDIQKKVDEYRQRKVLGIADLHEKKLNFGLIEESNYNLERDNKNKIEFTIYVCDVCSTLLKEASEAAYRVLGDR